MTKIVFEYNDKTGTCCVVSSPNANTLHVSRIRGEYTLDNISLDAYQAALLIPELERFIAQRSSHRVGDLTWRVTDATLYINDVPLLALCFGFQLDRGPAFGLVSKLLTRGADARVFSTLDGKLKTDMQLERWILDRLEELSNECEF